MSQSEVPSRVKDPRYPWKVLGIVMLGTMMSALDSSIVNVSLPAIMADFGASLDDIEWVVTGYMLAFATLMPLTAWGRERIGQKQLYNWSLVIFTLGSVLCGLAWNLPSLVAARVIQAFGGGAITPTGMAMITEEFSAKDRARALGYWGMGVIVGPAVGPTLGGWLTKVFGWRSIFLVNLPFGIIGIILGIVILRSDKPDRSKHTAFDFWGFVFLSLFLVFFLLAMSKGEHEGWTSAYIVTCTILSVIGFVGFLTVESLVEKPIVDISLFKNKVFSACMAVTVIRSIALFGGVFLLPLFLQQLKGLDEVESGLILLPGSLVIGAMMPLSPRLMERFGPRVVTIFGLLGVALFMYQYRDINPTMSTWQIIVPTLVRGVGIGCLFTPVMATALNCVPREKAGMASSMINLVQQVGGSIGIALLAMVLSHRIKFHIATFGATVAASSPIYRDEFVRVMGHAHLLGYTHRESAQIAGMSLGKSVVAAASSAAFGDSFLFGTGVVLVGSLSAILMPTHAKVPEGEHMAAME